MYFIFFIVPMFFYNDAQRFRALRWWAFETENGLPAPMFINGSKVSIRTVRQQRQNPSYKLTP